MNTLLKLPIGLQDFNEVISGGYLYVDKTRYIQRLMTLGKYYFLSRPRRFGKSLTLSTIKYIYQGRQDLYKGLWIENQWDWTKVHPVLHISFGSVGYRELGLEAGIRQLLQQLGQQFAIVFTRQDSIALMLKELIYAVCQQHGKVVLLIDEYDKPLIDYLDDFPQARINQQVMKTFYSILKDSDPYLEFMLITGISKFSKVSIFSDLNNLYDLTFVREAAVLTGYTQAELEQYFTAYLQDIADYMGLTHMELSEKIRQWYNGYSWDGRNRVYNPFSILSFCRDGEFRNFWFETGTPTFLPKLMHAQQIFAVDGVELDEMGFSIYAIEKLQVLPVLFQTGYLTLQAKLDNGLYRLGYPNREVKAAMLAYLMAEVSYHDVAYSTPTILQLQQAFATNDLARVITLIKSIFKNIPTQIFMKQAESYYHSLVYLVFFYLGVYAESEVNTNDGRLDCVVKTSQYIYILEFKLDQSADKALQQIKTKGYAEKYCTDAREKVLIGINFSSELKTVEEWKSERWL